MDPVSLGVLLLGTTLLGIAAAPDDTHEETCRQEELRQNALREETRRQETYRKQMLDEQQKYAMKMNNLQEERIKLQEERIKDAKITGLFIGTTCILGGLVIGYTAYTLYKSVKRRRQNNRQTNDEN